MSHPEILHTKSDAVKVEHFNQLVSAFIYPYLTPKGQITYKKAISEKNKITYPIKLVLFPAKKPKN